MYYSLERYFSRPSPHAATGGGGIMEPTIDAEGGSAAAMDARDWLNPCGGAASLLVAVFTAFGSLGTSPPPATLVERSVLELVTLEGVDLDILAALEAMVSKRVGPVGPVHLLTPLVVSNPRNLPSTYDTDLLSSFASALVPPICPLRNHFDSAPFSLSRRLVASFTFSENSGAHLGGPCHASPSVSNFLPLLFFGRSKALRSMEAMICSISAL